MFIITYQKYIKTSIHYKNIVTIDVLKTKTKETYKVWNTEVYIFISLLIQVCLRKNIFLKQWFLKGF